MLGYASGLEIEFHVIDRSAIIVVNQQREMGEAEKGAGGIWSTQSSSYTLSEKYGDNIFEKITGISKITFMQYDKKKRFLSFSSSFVGQPSPYWYPASVTGNAIPLNQRN